MKPYIKKSTHIFGIWILLCLAFLYSHDVEAQSFVRKKYRTHVMLEGSSLGVGPSISYNMNSYFALGINYYLVSEKIPELDKSGIMYFMSVDYFPFQRSNFYMGYGFGFNNIVWKTQFCTDYLAKTGCEDARIEWPSGMSQFKFGFRNTNSRSRITATFQLQYTSFGEPDYKLTNTGNKAALKSRYGDDVTAYKTQTDLLFGIGWLF